MQPPTVVRSATRSLVHGFIDVLHQEWGATSHDVGRALTRVAGYLVAATVISLAIFAMLSAPWQDSDDRYPPRVVNGLHIVVPENLQRFPIEQLVPLP